MTEDVETAAPTSPMLLDPESSRHPQPMYKMMRDFDPIFRIENAGVVVTRHADVEQVFKQPEIFSSAMSAADLGNIRPLIPLQIDLPQHRVYRKILQPIFSPQKMNALHDPITALVNELMDRFEGGRGDRLLQPVLGAVPVAGVPDDARSSDGRAAALSHHEGRHHPAAGRGRQAGGPRRNQGLPEGHGHLDLRLLRRDAEPAPAGAERRSAEPAPRHRGRRGSADARRDPRHPASCSSSPGWTRSPPRWTASSAISPRSPSSAGASSPIPTWCRGPSKSCCAGRRPSSPSRASRPLTPS